MKTTAIGAGLLACLLAGCENVSSALTPSADDDYVDLINESVAIEAELDDLGPTAVADLPVSGAATYEGVALVTLETQRESELIGNAEITADFAAGDVTGEMTNFIGLIDDGSIEELDGKISVTYGEIDTGFENEVYIEVDGTLSGEDDIVDIEAGLEGDFMGTPEVDGEAPAGVDMGSLDDLSSFEVNGSAVDGSMSVIGVRAD